MKRKVKGLLCVLAAVLCFVAGYQTAGLVKRRTQPKISATTIRKQLENCSDLTTAVMTYRGLIKYEDGEIPWISKKSFSMVYDARLKAGIDLSDCKITVTGKDVKIILPKVQLQSVEVQEDSLEFYDEKWALFNWTDKTDTTKAVQAAKENAEQSADVSSLKQKAQKQAKEVVLHLVEPVLPKDGKVSVTLPDAQTK